MVRHVGRDLGAAQLVVLRLRRERQAPALGHVAEAAGEVVAAWQRQLAQRHLEGDLAAILALVHDVATSPGRTRVVVRAAVSARGAASRQVQRWNQHVDGLSEQLSAGMTEHSLRSGIDAVDDAIVGAERDDRLGCCREDGPQEDRTVAQRLLPLMVCRHVAKDQHRTDDRAIAFAIGGAAVRDRKLVTVAGDEDRAVGEPLQGAVGERREDRHRGHFARFLADDPRHLHGLERAPGALRDAGLAVGVELAPQHIDRDAHLLEPHAVRVVVLAAGREALGDEPVDLRRSGVESFAHGLDRLRAFVCVLLGSSHGGSPHRPAWRPVLVHRLSRVAPLRLCCARG